MLSRTVLFSIAIGLGLGVAGCRNKNQAEAPRFEDSGKASHTIREEAPQAEGPRAVPAVVQPERGVLLRIARNTDKALHYKGTFTQEQDGKSRSTESGEFYLTFYTANQINDSSGRGLDLVAIVRTWLERSRTEFLANDKKVDKILPTDVSVIDLGPNFQTFRGYRCYAFDARNNVAQLYEDILTLKDGTQLRGRIQKTGERTVVLDMNGQPREIERSLIEKSERRTLPHMLHYDTPHHFFPIFSSRPVEVGESWAYKILMVIPVPQGNGGILPTHFHVRFTGTLRQMRGAHALVDYSAEGAFDSSAAEFQDRGFGPNRLVRHSMKLSGSVTLDAVNGIVLEKSESLKVHMDATMSIPQGPNKEPKIEQDSADIASTFKLEWLPPGTKLKNGDEVPPFK